MFSPRWADSVDNLWSRFILNGSGVVVWSIQITVVKNVKHCEVPHLRENLTCQLASQLTGQLLSYHPTQDLCSTWSASAQAIHSVTVCLLDYFTSQQHIMCICGADLHINLPCHPVTLYWHQPPTDPLRPGTLRLLSHWHDPTGGSRVWSLDLLLSRQMPYHEANWGSSVCEADGAFCCECGLWSVSYKMIHGNY